MLSLEVHTALRVGLALLACGPGAAGEAASASGRAPPGMADITPALSAYSVFDEAGEASGSSNWTRSYTQLGGVVTQTSNIHSGQYCSASQLGTILYAYSPVFDYTWSVDVASEDDDAVGIVFRVADTSNFYKYSHSNDVTGCRTLYKIWNGVRSELWSSSSYTPYTQGREYAFQVRTDGCRFVGHYQGREDFDITDPDCVAAGGVGVYSWASSGGRWSNMLLATSASAGPAPVLGQEPGVDLFLALAFLACGTALGACGASALWWLAARQRQRGPPASSSKLARKRMIDVDDRGHHDDLPQVCGSPTTTAAAVV